MRITTILAAAAATLSVLGFSARAEESGPAALAKALGEATVPLEKGLAKSKNAISGKYEIEDGALQLSVYTKKGAGFDEVVVDHRTGKITKDEKIGEGDDLKEAKEQAEAMAKAKRSLAAVVAKAVKANAGYRAVSATPMMKAGGPVAEVTLMKGEDVKTVTEQLY